MTDSSPNRHESEQRNRCATDDRENLWALVSYRGRVQSRNDGHDAFLKRVGVIGPDYVALRCIFLCVRAPSKLPDPIDPNAVQ